MAAPHDAPFEPTVWKIFSGPLGMGSQPQAKVKALKIASAFFREIVIAAVTNPDSARFLTSASVPQQGKWLGMMIHHAGYRLPGEDGYDAAKDIDNLPVINLAMDAPNWNRQPRNIDISKAPDVQDFVNGLTRNAADFATALFAATAIAAASGFGLAPPGAAADAGGHAVTTMSIDAASLASLAGHQLHAARQQQFAARVTTTQGPEMTKRVADGEAPDPALVDAMLSDAAARAAFETADFVVTDGTAAQREERPGELASEILSIDAVEAGQRMAQQALSLGSIIGCDPSNDALVQKAQRMYTGLVQNLCSYCAALCRNCDINWGKIAVDFLRFKPELFAAGDTRLELLRGTQPGGTQAKPWTSSDSIAMWLDAVFGLYSKAGYPMTGVKEIMLDQIEVFEVSEHVTDIKAIVNDYVKMVFRTFNNLVGNRITGTLFKLSGRRIDLAVILSIKKKSDIPSRNSGLMPAAERDAVRDILDAVTKVTKLGDSLDAEQNKHVTSQMANMVSAQTALKAQVAAMDQANKKRDGRSGDTTAAQKKQKTEQEKAAAADKKAKGKNASFSSSIPQIVEKEFYAKYSSGKKRCFFTEMAKVPGYEAWSLKCPRNKPGHKTGNCGLAHTGDADAGGDVDLGWMTSLLAKHGVVKSPPQ